MRTLNIAVIIVCIRLAFASCQRLLKLLPEEQRLLFITVACAQIEASIIKVWDEV